MGQPAGSTSDHRVSQVREAYRPVAALLRQHGLRGVRRGATDISVGLPEAVPADALRSAIHRRLAVEGIPSVILTADSVPRGVEGVEISGSAERLDLVGYGRYHAVPNNLYRELRDLADGRADYLHYDVTEGRYRQPTRATTPHP